MCVGVGPCLNGGDGDGLPGFNSFWLVFAQFGWMILVSEFFGVLDSVLPVLVWSMAGWQDGGQYASRAEKYHS